MLYDGENIISLADSVQDVISSFSPPFLFSTSHRFVLIYILLGIFRETFRITISVSYYRANAIAGRKNRCEEVNDIKAFCARNVDFMHMEWMSLNPLLLSFLAMFFICVRFDQKIWSKNRK